MEDEAVIEVGEVISQGLSMAPVGMAAVGGNGKLYVGC